MSVAGGVPAFDPRQLWRVAGGDVPGCPLCTLVTLSTQGLVSAEEYAAKRIEILSRL